jgi:hypothetical protein
MPCFYWFMGVNHDDSTRLYDYTLRTDSLYYGWGQVNVDQVNQL